MSSRAAAGSTRSQTGGPRPPDGPAAGTAALEEVRRWEQAAAARLDAENQQAQRLEQARREAAELVSAARRDAQAAAERHRAQRLASAQRDADEVLAAGRRSACALGEELRQRMPDLVAGALALVLPLPLAAEPRTET